VTPSDLQKLLGGYAAGTLTAEERRALFDAALADQTLFDALADEEALREVLADPACRERVQAALVERPPTAFWLRRPGLWTLAAATAAAAVVLTVAVLRTKPAPQTASAPHQIATAHKPVIPGLVPATPAPSPARATRPPTSPVHGAPVESEPRVTKSLPPPSLSAQRQQLAARAPAFAAKPSAPPAPAAADTVTPEPPSTRAAQPAQVALAVPPPPPATAQTVTVEAAAQAIQTEAAPASQSADSKAISNLSIAGRDAAELIKMVPGMGAAGGMSGPIGLRYTLLRRGEDDKDVEVPPDTTFRRHESVHLRIEAGQSGYLYVLAGTRALFAGPVVANQPVLIVTRPGVLEAVVLPQPDSGPLSTLVSRARQLQLEGARFQRSDGTHLGSGSGPDQPAPILAEISIKSR
jgi:hypothetical protein